VHANQAAAHADVSERLQNVADLFAAPAIDASAADREGRRSPLDLLIDRRDQQREGLEGRLLGRKVRVVGG